MNGGLDIAARGLAARALRASRVAIEAIAPPPEAGIVPSATPLVSGKAPASSLVTVYVNGIASGTAAASPDGTWALQLPRQLNGDYTLVARAVPASDVLAVTINDPLQPLTDYLGRAALFDMNHARGIYWTDGAGHADGADLLDAVGASVSGITAAFGGVEDGDSPHEYFPNPTFDALPTLASGLGFTASAVAGELNIVASGATNGYVSYAHAGYKGRAFKMTATARRGTITVNPPAFAHTLQGATLGGNLTSTAVFGASAATLTIFGSGAVTGSSYWGVRGTNAGDGTCYVDDWTLREVMPLAGWGDWADGNSAAAAPGWSCLFDGVLPAPPGSGNVVLAQADSGSENNRILLRLSSTGNLQLIVVYNAAVQTPAVQLLRAGVAGGEHVRVAFGITQATNDFSEGLTVSINGEPRQEYSAVNLSVPGVSHVRIGRDSAGTSVFTGTINQVAFLKGRAPGDWCEFASRLDDTPVVTGGDSYVNGANGVSLKASLASAAGLKVIDIGAGGTTLAQQVARYQAKPYLAPLRFVHWDGSDNGFSSITADIANYQALADAQGGTGRFVFLAPVAVPNPAAASNPTPGAQSIRCADRHDAMLAAFGAAHVFDPLPALQALSTGGADDLNDVAAGLVPRSCLFDASNGQVHLSGTAMDAVAAALVASGKIAAL
ncbi:hypothetical protein [Novosphingobium album (ex Liu et al. 2023)]|uniref:SGNH/GDSL hydrolase family protein n=1 Tax=Novosphingobium album (ex Liu et al. 2023) TaxID=3031130 RepID=A0ABT5WKB0_9SPHN|nr:hypothetical protein [Novosphingobium album (ex Liu et al. 2023)]MDE8650483.1 hypothetical protein [Novosphingobium album (ex Liu et al. 2023)]